MKKPLKRFLRRSLTGIGLLFVGSIGGGIADAGEHAHRIEVVVAPPLRTARDAGHPFCVKEHAIPSRTSRYAGYYVGGGSAFGGSGPCAHEGTWGWDYVGLGRLPKVRLGFTHGRRYQDGVGHYAIDGPKPLEAFKERIHGR